MKKLISVLICLIFVVVLSLSAMAEEVLYYAFDGNDNLTVVTNTLKSGADAKSDGSTLYLDGSYGLKLGSVNTTFTVSALVKVSSDGGTNTIFFKDMDGVGNKWTGVLSANKKPSFWTHDNSTFRWNTVASGDTDLSEWTYVTYVEKNSVGSLYVNGELVGTGNVANGSGTLYLGATYWSADAVTGLVDDVKLYNNALTEAEIMEEYEKHVDFENAIKLPGEVIGDIELPEKIASKTITWKTSDEGVITTDGKVTRGEEDKTVTLTAVIDGEAIGEFEVTVLKKPVMVNDEILLKYVFDENDGEIIHDKSGNGNHGAAYNSLLIGNDGANFDGNDDYVKMPEGVLYGHDSITIVMKMKPDGAQKHVFAYGFGNSSDTGYIFLNPSRPDTNLIRFAGTKSNSANEKAVESIPGIRSGQWATVAVSINGKYCSMYIDGELVMDGDMGMKVSDLGLTKENYIAKSLYANDPYFKGIVREFTIYNYSMSESKIQSLYKKEVEYAPEEVWEEYITDVSFENGIDVELDTFGRDDVKVAAVVLDENNRIIEAVVVSYDEEINLKKDGTVCVFAFNEKDNLPGAFYVKGNGDGFSYEYTPGEIAIISEKDFSNGMVIIAGYNVAGTLTGVTAKVVDINAMEKVIMDGDFNDAVVFKMLYWENLVSMTPVK